MKNKKRFYRLEFTEYSGETEHSYDYIIGAKGKKDAEKIAHEWLSDWWGKPKSFERLEEYDWYTHLIRKIYLVECYPEDFIRDTINRWCLNTTYEEIKNERRPHNV